MIIWIVSTHMQHFLFSANLRKLNYFKGLPSENPIHSDEPLAATGAGRKKADSELPKYCW